MEVTEMLETALASALTTDAHGGHVAAQTLIDYHRRNPDAKVSERIAAALASDDIAGNLRALLQEART